MIFVPVASSVPTSANALAPSAMMKGTLANVSALLMTVGLAHRPDTVGNGGLRRGSRR